MSRFHFCLDSLATCVRSLSGWHRGVLAVVLGGLTAAAMPPVGAWLLLVVVFSGLVWLLDGTRSGWRAFVTGWFFGVGFFFFSMYWVVHALLIDPERFAWTIPLALPALATGLALFPGLATWLTMAVSRPGPQRGIALAGAWTMSEIARGTLFGGLPWNLVAHTWTAVDTMMQPAALVGTYGMGLLTVLVAAVPATLVSYSGMPAGWRTRGGVAVLLLLLLLWSAGAGRLLLAGPVAIQPMVEGVRLRLVQPNTAQSLRWVPELRRKNFLQLVTMSLQPGFDKVTHIIWPETASAFSLDWDEEARKLVATAAPPGGAVLTGMVRTTFPAVRPMQVWNSLVAIDPAGSVAALYDKAHLVPFGEYIPLRNLLPLPKITIGSTDFSPGPGLQTMSAPGIPSLSPLICYEVIFPGAVVERSGHPQWMLNVTNDAWFGLSAGPYQHFASARWRAVEEGMPLVRVGVTGISGVIDPYGRVVERLGLGVAGIRDVQLPVALTNAPLFARWGNAPAAVLAIFCLGVALALRRRRQRSESMAPHRP